MVAVAKDVVPELEFVCWTNELRIPYKYIVLIKTMSKGRRSYTKKTKRPQRNMRLRSKKKKQQSFVYNAMDIIGPRVLLNKGGDHVYEDRVSKYIGDKYVLLGLFDGHSGKSTSEHLSNSKTGLLAFIVSKMRNTPVSGKLIHDAFVEFDNKRLRKLSSGATATVVYIDKYKTIVANVGDSPAYSLKNCKMKQLSVEHDYFNLNERKRVLNKSKDPDIWEDQRVHGTIQASRGMGDFEIKDLEQGIFISNPSIKVISKDEHSSMDYLLITSDGITDPFTEKYESKNTGSDGYPNISDKQMLKNSLRNFKSVICENGKLKPPKDMLKGITNLAIQLVDGDYQDDISMIMVDMKKCRKHFN